ncbi:Ancient conserved domain-containing protein 4 [Intoshia linei]|uniref:Ancient conserved domain-containing protein 4 n=1 Tax=Intoshia linei TaxID=1819745 RepID=A0A177B3U5_9BILA|nr:Ancient conserved domain-containing protein 4 [Intoshia linei]
MNLIHIHVYLIYLLLITRTVISKDVNNRTTPTVLNNPNLPTKSGKISYTTHIISHNKLNSAIPYLYRILLLEEETDQEITETQYNNSPIIKTNVYTKIRLIGQNFEKNYRYCLSSEKDLCYCSESFSIDNFYVSPNSRFEEYYKDIIQKNTYTLSDFNKESDKNKTNKKYDYNVTIVDVSMKSPISNDYVYICIEISEKDHLRMYQENEIIKDYLNIDRFFIHLGTDFWNRLYVVPVDYKLPTWLLIIFITILLALSGLFSGLNLGLMALDITELRIIENSGTVKERKFAKIISPVRIHGSLVLCTILLGNVLVNSTLAVLLEGLTGSGWIAIVVSTFCIVIFGEIIPQAVCFRHGLAIAAYTIIITKFFILLTFPLSFPFSKVLDFCLGKEVGKGYNRDRLREVIRISESTLAKNEVNIITGALTLSKKRVRDIMTPVEDVFMIDVNSILDFDTMVKIIQTGYTRIPIYSGNMLTIVSILNIKDLAFVDPDDKIPLHTICQFYEHDIEKTYSNAKLDELLEKMRKGQSHIWIVQDNFETKSGDPYTETVGLVTLEDIIEEIIQAEIIDETDTISDNRLKKPRKVNIRDFSIFKNMEDEPTMTAQLRLATFQFLKSFPVFSDKYLTDTLLNRLLSQNTIQSWKPSDFPGIKNEVHYIFRRGQVSDFFVLILSGMVEVCVGAEQMKYYGESFHFFGIPALECVLLDSKMDMPKISEAKSDDISKKNVTFVQDKKPKEKLFTLDEKSIEPKTDPSEYAGETILKKNYLSNIPNKINNSIISKIEDTTTNTKQTPQGYIYIPDFTVSTTADIKYLKITRTKYLAAIKASNLERNPLDIEIIRRSSCTDKSSGSESNVQSLCTSPMKRNVPSEAQRRIRYSIPQSIFSRRDEVTEGNENNQRKKLHSIESEDLDNSLKRDAFINKSFPMSKRTDSHNL